LPGPHEDERLEFEEAKDQYDLTRYLVSWRAARAARHPGTHRPQAQGRVEVSEFTQTPTGSIEIGRAAGRTEPSPGRTE
jgi:hypothetical protein